MQFEPLEQLIWLPNKNIRTTRPQPAAVCPEKHRRYVLRRSLNFCINKGIILFSIFYLEIKKQSPLTT